jgi:hypothetical protein
VNLGHQPILLQILQEQENAFDLQHRGEDLEPHEYRGL